MRRMLLLASTALISSSCSEGTTYTPPVTQAPATVSGADFVTEAQLFVHECEPGGTGEGIIDDKISDFSFKNCVGDDVHLHDLCGRRRALWLIGAAGWCGQCIAHMPDVVRLGRERRHQGLETLVFLAETDRYEGIDQDYCLGFAEEHGLDPARLIYDPNAQDGLQSLWNYVRPNGGQGGSIGLPWEAVLDPYDMTFVWESMTADGWEDVLDALLAE